MPPEPPKGKPKSFGPPAVKRDIWFELLILFIFIITFGAAFLPFINGDIVFSLEGYLAILEKYAAPIFVILDVILLAGTIYAIARAWPLRPKLSLFERAVKRARPAKDPQIKIAWERIMARAATGTLESLRLSLIEADAFVDSFLKRQGYEGEHMADRLSRIDPDEIKTLERVWKAHRLRNDVVHTPGFTVFPDSAKSALKAFDDFLKELEAI